MGDPGGDELHRRPGRAPGHGGDDDQEEPHPALYYGAERPDALDTEEARPRAPSGRSHHGLPVRLGDHDARRRHPRGAGRSLRGPRRLGPPDARSALRVRGVGRAARTRGDHRRRRRRGAPAGHDRREDAAARARRARRVAHAERARFAALDRADAGRRPGRDARHRPGRRGQRRAARGGHPGHEAPALPRGGRALPRPADARGARRPGSSPDSGALRSPRRVREGRRPRRRPARPDAGARRLSARHPLPVPRPVAGGAGRPRGRAGRRRIRRPGGARPLRGRARARHLRVRERPRRLRPAPRGASARCSLRRRRSRWRRTG